MLRSRVHGKKDQSSPCLLTCSHVISRVTCLNYVISVPVYRPWHAPAKNQAGELFWCPYRNVDFPAYNPTQGSQLLKATGKNQACKHYPSNYCCFTKQQRFYSLFVQTWKRLLPVLTLHIYIHEQGSKKFHCSCVQLLRVAHLIITLSGDIEENPGPFTETNDHKKVLCSKSVWYSFIRLESSLLELGRLPVKYWEMETVFSLLCHASYITPLSISIYAFLEFSIFCITLSYI